MKRNKNVAQLSGMSIRGKLICSFGILLFLIALVAGNAVYRLSEAKVKITEIVTDDYPSTALANNLIRDVNSSSIDFLNALIVKDADVKNKLISGLTERSRTIDGIYEQLSSYSDEPASRNMLAGIQRVRGDYAKSRAVVISYINTNPDAAINEYLTRTYALEQQYIEKINEYIDVQREDMQTSYDDYLRDYDLSKLTMLIITLISIATGMVMALLISRAIVNPIKNAVAAATRIAAGELDVDIQVTSKDETGVLTRAISTMQHELKRIVSEIRSGAENIATGASQIMAGTHDLSARTEEQASSVEETAASMEQVSATVKNTGDNTINASQLSERASSAAKDNGRLMVSLTGEIKNISGSAEKMSDIINLIDSIAFQTNILALNAAVEAARAGEHGKGFAVVAQEVRNLAQKTTNSSKDIRTLIENATSQTVRGLAMVGEVNSRMDEMVVNVDSVSNILKEIEQASIEQSGGIQQINIAIGQIDTTTQQNAALVEESVAAAEMLNDQAKVMKELVSVFKLSRHG